MSPEDTATVGALPSLGEDLVAGTRLGNRYRLGSVLGRGGFGTVYRARDELLDRPAAIKVLEAHRLTGSGRERVRREVALSRGLESDRLVRVHDLAESDDRLYIVMEVVDGESLRELLAREGPLPVERALALASEILRALGDLHREGVVHRDLKPANVLVPPDGRLKLIDLGLARSLDDDPGLTATSQILGTAAYAYPELGDDREIGPVADLYSFGVVLYEMLTGERPFSGTSSLEVLKAHLSAPVPDVRTQRPDVPGWLALLVSRLLAKKPADRPPSADAVLEAIERQGRGVAPWSLHGRRFAPAALIALCVGLATFAGFAGLRRDPPRGELVNVVRENDVLRGVDAEGGELWRLENVAGDAKPVRLRDESLDVAAVLGPPGEPHPPYRELVVLDGATGRELRRLRWEDHPSNVFRDLGFADRYYPVLDASDLDGDGFDEILVTLTHQPYWPSYTILVEPRLGRVRPVFLASGHHRPAGAADLDGDGVREILFTGINNRLGFRQALAAVAPFPPPGASNPSFEKPAVAVTPDASYSGGMSEPLWYTLLPLGTCTRPDCLQVDPEARRIRLEAAEGRPTVERDFSGLPPGAFAAEEIQRVLAARSSAFARFRRAERLEGAGRVDDAVAILDEAVASAHLAEEAHFGSWLELHTAALLAREGRLAEARPRWESVIATAPSLEAGAEAAYQAALSLHADGSLPEAISYYRRALASAVSRGVGRSPNDVLLHLVLAEVELGTLGDALEDIERFDRIHPGQIGDSLALRAFVAWRGGARPEPLPTQLYTWDVKRYWNLEIRRLHGEEPESLLEAVDEELELTSGTGALVLSLRAELLEDLGRGREAELARAAARERIESGRDDALVLRAHRDVLAERGLRLDGRPGATPPVATEVVADPLPGGSRDRGSVLRASFQAEASQLVVQTGPRDSQDPLPAWDRRGELSDG